MVSVEVAGGGGGGGVGLDVGRELLQWLVLRRVRDGGVARVGQVYLDRGRRTADFLAGPIEELIAAGLVGLGDPEPVAEASWPVVLTETGLARYTVLRERQRPWARDCSAQQQRVRPVTVLSWTCSPRP
jgi:hypothetical protein